eukprot:430476-Hanusia_phi.AAC.1
MLEALEVNPSWDGDGRDPVSELGKRRKGGRKEEGGRRRRRRVEQQREGEGREEERRIWDGELSAGMRRYVEWQNSCVTAEEMRRARFIEMPALHQTALFVTAAVLEACLAQPPASLTTSRSPVEGTATERAGGRSLAAMWMCLWTTSSG